MTDENLKCYKFIQSLGNNQVKHILQYFQYIMFTSINLRVAM